MILNPHQIGKHINLPFYPAHRYAAVPGSDINDEVQVEIHPERPASLVYHDHCFHLMDLKVNLSLSLQFLYCVPCLQIPQDIHFDKAREKKNSFIQSGSALPETTRATKVKVFLIAFTHCHFGCFQMYFRIPKIYNLDLVLWMRSCL